MKKCPQCSRECDPSMSFCLDDGAELHVLAQRAATIAPTSDLSRDTL